MARGRVSRTGSGGGRARTIAKRLLASLSVVLCLLPRLVGAADGVPPRPVDEARRLLSGGDAPGALVLARKAVADDPDDPDANFVLGMSALVIALDEASPGGGPWTGNERQALLDEAADAFGRILANRPGLPRPRLELARVLFERGRCREPPERLLRHFLGDECDEAERHFRRVLASEPPPVVVANVNRFLAAIRARKRLSGSFAITVAPDTNVNAATGAETVRIFGLPFTLNEDARPSTGIGLRLRGAGEYQHPLAFRGLGADAARLRIGAAVLRTDYGGRRFDETTVSLHAGPRLLYGRGEVSLLATMNRRWYAGEAFGEGRGVRLEGSHRLDGRTRLGGRIGTTRQTHRRPSQNDGHRFHAGLDLARYLTPALRLRVRGGWRRARTESPHERHTRRWVGASAELDLPRIGRIRGLVLDLSRDFHFTGYDRARLAYHPDPRRDRFDVSRLTVYSRVFEYRGFTPAFSLVHERRESNIALYDYDRTRVEFTIQRRF